MLIERIIFYRLEYHQKSIAEEIHFGIVIGCLFFSPLKSRRLKFKQMFGKNIVIYRIFHNKQNSTNY